MYDIIETNEWKKNEILCILDNGLDIEVRRVIGRVSRENGTSLNH